MFSENYKKELKTLINSPDSGADFLIDEGMGGEWEICPKNREPFSQVVLYGSPFWEGTEGIAWDVLTEDGESLLEEFQHQIPYTATGNPQKDALIYLTLVNEEIARVQKRLPPKQNFENVVAKRAEEIFWSVVAAHYPDVKTGDFSPEDTERAEKMFVELIKTWLRSNRPEVK